MSVDRARRIDYPSLESLDDDVVMLDPGRLQYHSFEGRAFEVWSALDGATSREAIAALVYPEYGAAGLAMVDLALDQLAAAELLDGVDAPAPAVVNRRRALRIAAAGLAGAVGLPVVRSITAPDSAAALTPTQVPLPVIREGQRCAGDHRTGYCEDGTCCLFDPSADIFGYCRPNGTYGYPCT